jgi:prepilin-type N-terminal cleavage/methylation domain-containing protein
VLVGYQQGFSLIEVMVAAAILSFSLLGFVNLPNLPQFLNRGIFI